MIAVTRPHEVLKKWFPQREANFYDFCEFLFVLSGYGNRKLVENGLIFKEGAGYRIALPVRWQIIYESPIFYEITAKYEKQIKYLSILLQATCDNYIIITQKYARDEI